MEEVTYKFVESEGSDTPPQDLQKLVEDGLDMDWPKFERSEREIKLRLKGRTIRRKWFVSRNKKYPNWKLRKLRRERGVGRWHQSTSS